MEFHFDSLRSQILGCLQLLAEHGAIKTLATKTEYHFIYEIAVFFEAAKSALDFVAT